MPRKWDQRWDRFGDVRWPGAAPAGPDLRYAQHERGVAREAYGLRMTNELKPRDRLLMRQNRDNHICIYSGHARDVLGVSSLQDLVDLINEAVAEELLERRTEQSERLDAERDKGWNIGLRLTERGKRHAARLEDLHGAFRPFGSPR